MNEKINDTKYMLTNETVVCRCKTLKTQSVKLVLFQSHWRRRRRFPSLWKTIEAAFIKDSWATLCFNWFIFIEPFGPKFFKYGSMKKKEDEQLVICNKDRLEK